MWRSALARGAQVPTEAFQFSREVARRLSSARAYASSSTICECTRWLFGSILRASIDRAVPSAPLIATTELDLRRAHDILEYLRSVGSSLGFTWPDWSEYIDCAFQAVENVLHGQSHPSNLSEVFRWLGPLDVVSYCHFSSKEILTERECPGVSTKQSSWCARDLGCAIVNSRRLAHMGSFLDAVAILLRAEALFNEASKYLDIAESGDVLEAVQYLARIVSGRLFVRLCRRLLTPASQQLPGHHVRSLPGIREAIPEFDSLTLRSSPHGSANIQGDPHNDMQC